MGSMGDGHAGGTCDEHGVLRVNDEPLDSTLETNTELYVNQLEFKQNNGNNKSVIYKDSITYKETNIPQLHHCETSLHRQSVACGFLQQGSTSSSRLGHALATAACRSRAGPAKTVNPAPGPGKVCTKSLPGRQY